MTGIVLSFGAIFKHAANRD